MINDLCELWERIVTLFQRLPRAALCQLDGPVFWKPMTRTRVSEAWLAVKTGGRPSPVQKKLFFALIDKIRRWLFLFIETRIVHGHILRVNHYLQCSGWWLLWSLWRYMHLSGLQHLLLPKVGAFQGSACLWDCVTKPCSDYRNSGQHHSSEIHMNSLVAHTWLCLSNFIVDLLKRCYFAWSRFKEGNYDYLKKLIRRFKSMQGKSKSIVESKLESKLFGRRFISIGLAFIWAWVGPGRQLSVSNAGSKPLEKYLDPNSTCNPRQPMYILPQDMFALSTGLKYNKHNGVRNINAFSCSFSRRYENQRLRWNIRQ